MGDWPNLIPIVIGIVGLATVIFAALRYRRDDTTAVLGQQDALLNEMKTINDEHRDRANRLRVERDECRDELSGQVTKLHKKLDEDADRN